MPTDNTNKPSLKNRREFLFAVLTVCLSTAFCLLLAEYALRWYQDSIQKSESMEAGLLRYHGRLGWDLTPGWQGRHKHHDFDVAYSINTDGFRGLSLQAADVGAERQLAIVGDSFSFGLGVDDDNTFSAYLNNISSRTRTLNLSIPGYSTDQQLMLLKQLDGRLPVQDVVLVVYLANDLLDNMLDYPLQVERAKPRYALTESGLEARNIPVPRGSKPAALRSMSLARVIFGDRLDTDAGSSLPGRSALWRRLVPEQAKMHKTEVDEILGARLQAHKALMRAIVLEMREHVKSRGIRFHIAVISGRSHILAPASYSALFQDYVLAFIRELATANDIPLINIAGQMRELEKNDRQGLYHPHEGHLTAAGHRLAANLIAKALRLETSRN